jgi:hypothetical protein
MHRIRELIEEVYAEYPRDNFFNRLSPTFRDCPQTRSAYAAYNRAFLSLEAECWQLLKRKAVDHFLDHREGQLKQGFFNQLNEAFAYAHLRRRGYSVVRMLPESRVRQPDITFVHAGVKRVCEVKTVGISEDEIRRSESNVAYSGEVYSKLSDQYITKLQKTVACATHQITSQGGEGLVYLIVKFDDFTLTHYSTYRKQIVAALSACAAPWIYVKVGLQGNRYIEKSQ